MGLFFSLTCLLATVGCGTTRMSDSARTANEQLLVTSAVEQAIDLIDFEPLSGKAVFLDTQYLAGVSDQGYVTSTLRQHLVASGCIIKTDVKEATYVVEARGMVGTNRDEVLLGIPSMSLPNLGVPGVPSAIPEIAFAKRTAQEGVAKISVFAYNRETGHSVWQSGTNRVASNARNTWLLGAGPIQRGSIYPATGFAGTKLKSLFRHERAEPPPPPSKLAVTKSRIFVEPERPIAAAPPAAIHPSDGSAANGAAAANAPASVSANSGVVQASATAPAPAPSSPAANSPAKPAAPPAPSPAPGAPPAAPAAQPPTTSASGNIINSAAPAVNVPDTSWTGTPAPSPAGSGPWSGLMLVPSVNDASKSLLKR